MVIKFNQLLLEMLTRISKSEVIVSNSSIIICKRKIDLDSFQTAETCKLSQYIKVLDNIILIKVVEKQRPDFDAASKILVLSLMNFLYIWSLPSCSISYVDGFADQKWYLLSKITAMLPYLFTNMYIYLLCIALGRVETEYNLLNTNFKYFSHYFSVQIN